MKNIYLFGCFCFISYPSYYSSVFIFAMLKDDILPSGDTVAVVDAPQLFESGFDKHCDYIVGVIADKNVRIRRIMARDGITKEAAEARIASQKSDEFFVENCDFIVYNNGGVDALEEQVANILRKIGKRA